MSDTDNFYEGDELPCHSFNFYKGHEQAISDIVSERLRHISDEGWSPEHDDEHGKRELARAAAVYAIAASYSDGQRSGREVNDKITSEYENLRFTTIRELWPWDWKWWKPTDRRRDLVKAGALIVAEIERLDRVAANKS